MKNLILVAVIFQLVITVIVVNGDYKFGDIIEFPRKCTKNNRKPLYIHYAIYVGPKKMRDVGQEENDIFHRTGAIGKSSCSFGKLKDTKKESNVITNNYLDNIMDSNGNREFPPGTPEEITARITEAITNCKRYKLFTNNCEHLATYVRYGKAKSLQNGAVGSCFLAINREAKALLAKVRQDVENEAECEPQE